LVVERVPVQERRPAALAEEIGFDRRRLAETRRANGNSGNFQQWLAANAAIIGEKKAEKSARGCSDDPGT
jgi:hypothetical protein